MAAKIRILGVLVLSGAAWGLLAPSTRGLQSTRALPSSRAAARPARYVGLRSDPSDDDDDEPLLERRLSTTEESVAAATLTAAAAALAGVEVLDAGFLSSALLVGAAVGFAAENERDYGVGDVARGLGKMGWKAFEAARKAPDAAAEASEATMEAASSFDDKISQIRKDLEADKRRAAAEAPKFAAEE